MNKSERRCELSERKWDYCMLYMPQPFMVIHDDGGFSEKLKLLILKDNIDEDEGGKLGLHLVCTFFQ